MMIIEFTNKAVGGGGYDNDNQVNGDTSIQQII